MGEWESSFIVGLFKLGVCIYNYLVCGGGALPNGVVLSYIRMTLFCGDRECSAFCFAYNGKGFT